MVQGVQGPIKRTWKSLLHVVNWPSLKANLPRNSCALKIIFESKGKYRDVVGAGFYMSSNFKNQNTSHIPSLHSWLKSRAGKTWVKIALFIALQKTFNWPITGKCEAWRMKWPSFAAGWITWQVMCLSCVLLLRQAILPDCAGYKSNALCFWMFCRL